VSNWEHAIDTVSPQHYALPMKPLLCCVVCVLLTVCAVTQQTRIPSGARVFIEKMDGFEDYLAAAFQAKQVPVVVVTDKDKADFVISGSASSDSRDPHHQRATIKAVDKNGTVVFAYAFDDDYAIHGKQSAAEACAKNLKKEIAGK
jgi:hypothetical protein